MTVTQSDLPPETGPSDEEFADAVASVGDLPLRLTFDLGEHTLTLRELSAVGPGHTFPLARGPADAVVLRINGMRVGEGELVSIDGQLGVSITRIAPPGTP